jgi:signal transduction histidine kinase
VDVHRLEQVFRNVLENAIHACREKGTITIRCTNTEWQGEPAVRVAVQDDGAGMTDDIATQIFEPFFTTKQKGTGLGMAIVHRIIAAHAGCISAGSLKPRGSEILLILPCHTSIRNAVRF